MTTQPLPRFPYGAVYYRRSNPPREDWGRDYATAAHDGMNAFRHWFMWGAIEVAPSEFNWEPYDRQLDLAAEHGFKTIIAEMATSAPEWAFRRYAHARFQTAAGLPVAPHTNASSATGGWPGLCLDNPDAQEAAGTFLAELITRYSEHPGLGGYDIWNECNIPSDVCYCPGTEQRFREWLLQKYGDVRTLGDAWNRFSFANWDDVTAPRVLGPYPDSLDWLQFRIDNAYRLMRWRADLIRERDPDHAIVAHGIAATLTGLAPRAADDWRAAAEVEVYGYTWGSSRHGDEPWKQYHAVDLVRAASHGKPFWHAESYAGPLWMAPNVIGKPRAEGRIAAPEDVRLWDMVSFAAGARGVFRLRWRPLLDGPLFGAFGPYGLDGSQTPRSEMVSRIGQWAQSQDQLMKAAPIQGDIGILIVPESQLFAYAQQGTTDSYARAAQGAYQGFFANNIQADWARLEDIADYDLVYLPFPVMLEEATARTLRSWVEAGGTLIAEGCPGYFGDRGHVGQTQPNLGLDEMFGVRESYVEFTPDLLEDLVLTVGGQFVRGGLFLQAYAATSGTPLGTYSDGRIAAVENRFGRGRTLLVGTFPGYGHGRHPDRGCREFFAWLLDWAGKVPHVRTTEPRVTVRLQEGNGGPFLWLTNPTPTDLYTLVDLAPRWGPFAQTETCWGTSDVRVEGNRISLVVPARDATVLKLLPAAEA